MKTKDLVIKARNRRRRRERVARMGEFTKGFMKHLALFTLIVGLCLSCYGEHSNEVCSAINSFYGPEFGRTIIEKAASLDGTNYLIRFDCNKRFLMRPATISEGVPHYDAEISVHLVGTTNNTLLCQPFHGYYTGGKCWEDKPEDLIRRALQARTDEKGSSSETLETPKL